MPEEEWRWVPDFEGYYQVSDLGRVRSVDRNIAQSNYVRRIPGRILAAPLSGPYRMVNLWRGNRQRTIRVHQLVARAFIGPPSNPKLEVCHNDGDGLNNCRDNLRWDSRQGNDLDQVKHGTHPSARKTHCKRGHEFTPENTIRVQQFKNGRVSNQRKCRECARSYDRKRRAA